jgi:hypothetical protein
MYIDYQRVSTTNTPVSTPGGRGNGFGKEEEPM